MFSRKDWYNETKDARNAVRRERYKLCRDRIMQTRRNSGYLARSYKHRRTRNRNLINKYKSAPCADCKKRYPYYVMDFDHVAGGKTMKISSMLQRSTKVLAEEIKKCQVVCSNCHRKRTFARIGRGEE